MTLEVRLRNGFSDRNGIKKENNVMQLTDFDERTRVAFCNFIDRLFYNYINKSTLTGQQIILKSILEDVYVIALDSYATYDIREVLEVIKETIIEDNYDAVLTFLEYIINLMDNYFKESDKGNIFGHNLNMIFKKEYVGYRYVNNYIVPITNDNEINAIEQATHTQYEKVNQFLNKALEKISDRENPDYENSVKESISAVEEMCNIILGKADTLGASLKKLEDSGVAIHPSLKEAFIKLYGYTSDESGIRHAGRIDGKNTTFAEAKFMLIACSAFVNYLIDNIKN